MNIPVIIAFIILIVVLGAFVLYTLSMLNSILRNVPQVGTFGKSFRALRNHSDNLVTSGQTLLDLGSGTGKVCRYFSSHHNMEVIGYEVDLGNILLARFLNLFTRKSPRYVFGSFLGLQSVDFQGVDCIYVYLFPHLVERIEQELVPHMKPWTRIIANSFPFPNLEPSQVLEGKIYIYEL